MGSSKTVELDLLIVGGGLQGLTLLHHCNEDRPGSALLVSRDSLGTGETLHSHGYLHKGHFLPPEQASLIPAFAESFRWWNDWMREHEVQYEESARVFYDLPEENYETVTAIWSDAGLPYEDLNDLPAPLRSGVYSTTRQRRLVQIHDRLIPSWRIVEKLSDPLQHLLMRGELKNMTWDPQNNRIAECTVKTSGGDLAIRPRAVVLATGRDTQPLLRNIEGPDGDRPFADSLNEINLIRDVPMILIQGTALPDLSGWFFLKAPITMMSHSLENGERMWVVTLMEGHHSSQEDFENQEIPVDGTMIQRTLEALWGMVPELKDHSGEFRFSSYIGPKIDHPERIPRWFIGDGGIDNLRFVWPVLWGLTHSASRELMRELSQSILLDSPPRPFDASEYGIRMGVEAGGELRLSPSLRWHTLEEWQTLHQFKL